MNRCVLFAVILGLLTCPCCEAQSEDKGCEIEWQITGSFPPERLDPEIANLNGKDARDNYFAPGSYRMELVHPGFFPISEEIVIPAGQKVLHIERVLRAKPRRIQVKITHDVPPEGIAPYLISLALFDKPQETRVVRDGDEIQPGYYFLNIAQQAYEPVTNEKQLVWPAEEPFVIEKELVAKQVVIKLNISYDVEPPKDLSECQALFLDQQGIPHFATDGSRIKPSNYELEIQRPGYAFGPRKPIYIAPSDQPYQITEKLIAKPRPISVENFETYPYQLINATTGKDITFNDKFKPGEEVDCIVKFRRFETVRARIKVIPGEGPFIANTPLKKLVKYEFTSRQNLLEMDNMQYPFVLYADAESIESHLIECESAPGRRWLYTIWVDPTAKNLVVYAGYRFAAVLLDRVAVSGIPRLDKINIPRLIEHLEQVARREARGYAAATEALAALLDDPASQAKLKVAPKVELAQLLQQVQSWPIAAGEAQTRWQAVIAALAGLVKDGQ